MPDPHHIARIVRAFIAKPGDYRCFKEFYALCFHTCRGYLRQKAARGHRLPVQDYAGQDPVSDLTVDCLSLFFERSGKNKTWTILQSLTGFVDGEPSDESVAAYSLGTFRRKTDQALSRLEAERFPQRYNIRREILRTLSKDEFERFTHCGQQFVSLRGTDDYRRLDCPPIDDNTLRQYATQACRSHSQLPKRVMAVMESIDADGRFIGGVETQRMVTAFSDVLMEIDSDSSDYPAPDQEHMRMIIAQCAQQALDRVLGTEMERLAADKKFTDEERVHFNKSLRSFAEDFAQYGNYDALPKYLRERFPQWDARLYLNRYKYNWETIVTSFIAETRNCLRKQGLDPFEDQPL